MSRVPDTFNDGSLTTTALYAWIGRDENGLEGICAIGTRDLGTVSLVFADLDRAQRIGRQAAVVVAAETGRTIRLVRFERVDTLDVVGAAE